REGCGWDPEDVRRLLRGTDEEGLWREATTAPKHLHKRKGASDDADNISIKPKHGTSRAYLLSRLKKERPDLLASVERKELSVRQAAIAALNSSSSMFMSSCPFRCSSSRSAARQPARQGEGCHSRP